MDKDKKRSKCYREMKQGAGGPARRPSVGLKGHESGIYAVTRKTRGASPAQVWDECAGGELPGGWDSVGAGSTSELISKLLGRFSLDQDFRSFKSANLISAPIWFLAIGTRETHTEGQREGRNAGESKQDRSHSLL